METKHTKEYAEHLAKFHLVNISDDWSESSFTAGYMRAIEETAAPEMLEALMDMRVIFHSWLRQDKKTIGYKCAEKALSVITKATK